MPEWGKYATGIFYLDKNTHLEAEKDFDTLAASLGIKVLYWRDVPVNPSAIGAVARKSEPLLRQVFVTADLEDEVLIRQVRNQSSPFSNGSWYTIIAFYLISDFCFTQACHS